MNAPNLKNKKAFVLLEVILAMGLFVLLGTALLNGFKNSGNLSKSIRKDTHILSKLQSTLEEVSKLPFLEEGEETLEPDDRGVSTHISVEELTLENQDGLALTSTYKINVLLTWKENGKRQKASAETWRYLALYQP